MKEYITMEFLRLTRILASGKTRMAQSSFRDTFSLKKHITHKNSSSMYSRFTKKMNFLCIKLVIFLFVSFVPHVANCFFDHSDGGLNRQGAKVAKKGPVSFTLLNPGFKLSFASLASSR